MPSFKFDKMHGCGNDFVLLDLRNQNINLSKELIKNTCDRHFGIGCDQLIVLSESKSHDVQYQFYNPDASEAEQCGNGQRCIAWYLHRQIPTSFSFKVIGLAGEIRSQILDKHQVKINIGKVSKVSKACINDTSVFEVQLANPHRVLELDDVTNCDLNQLKQSYCMDGDINFEAVQIINQQEIKLRVHERGTGETLACGSGACAAVVALQTTKQLNECVKVRLPGGDLMVEYNSHQDEIYLTGAAKFVFSGEYYYD